MSTKHKHKKKGKFSAKRDVQCTPVEDFIGSVNFRGFCDGTVVPIFKAKTASLPTVTIDFATGECPVTLIIVTKDRTITEVIPTNVEAGFTFKNVKKILAQCPDVDPSSVCAFVADLSIHHCICCPENKNSKSKRLIAHKESETCTAVTDEAFPSHSGLCDGSIKPVFRSDVLPTVTLHFDTNGSDCPITLAIRRKGRDIIKVIPPDREIVITTDCVKEIKVRCQESKIGFCNYFAILEIHHCVCCPNSNSK